MLNRLRYFEPARMRAVYTALIALALSLGIAIPADVDAKVTALIGALAVVLPLLQGETTRAVVTPSAVAGTTVEDYSDSAVEVEADDLALADRTDPDVADGMGEPPMPGATDVDVVTRSQAGEVEVDDTKPGA